MPYPKHKPISEKEMLEPATEEEMAFSRYAGHHTICQTLRDIWSQSSDEEVRLKCRLAVSMAKAMVVKLKTYRDLVGADTADQIEKRIDHEICYKSEDPTEQAMVKVTNEGPDPSVVKSTICGLCGATLEYVPLEVQKYEGKDYSGGSDGREWIVCPKCGSDVTLESW